MKHKAVETSSRGFEITYRDPDVLDHGPLVGVTPRRQRGQVSRSGAHVTKRSDRTTPSAPLQTRQRALDKLVPMFRQSGLADADHGG